jgi:hypothetical protein
MRKQGSGENYIMRSLNKVVQSNTTVWNPLSLLLNEELNDLYCSPNIIHVNK